MRKLLLVLPWLVACGGAAPAPQEISSTAPPGEPDFSCPPPEQLTELREPVNEYQEPTEIVEGAGADLEDGDGEYLGYGTFSDLDGDGDLDVVIGTCMHEDCWGSVEIQC